MDDPALPEHVVAPVDLIGLIHQRRSLLDASGLHHFLFPVGACFRTGICTTQMGPGKEYKLFFL